MIEIFVVLFAALFLGAFFFSDNISKFYQKYKLKDWHDKVNDSSNYLYKIGYYSKYGGNVVNGVNINVRYLAYIGNSTSSDDIVKILNNLVEIIKTREQMMYLFINYASKTEVQQMFNREYLLNLSDNIKSIQMVLDQCNTTLKEKYYHNIPIELRHAVDNYQPLNLTISQQDIVNEIFGLKPKETIVESSITHDYLK